MSSPIEFYKKSDGAKDLILFVHGFMGGHSSWENNLGSTFSSFLEKDEILKNNFDIASYSYYSKLTDLKPEAVSTYKRVKRLFTGNHEKIQKNLSIEELSNNLRDHLRFSFEEYDNIYVIAHSMGGLIVKSAIVEEIKNSGNTKIGLFISLAVPHLGATLATLGGMVSSNLQIKGLNSVLELIPKLNEEWLKLDSKPVIKYFYGSLDTIVTQASAQSIEVSEKDIISVNEDHSSISKPHGESSIVVLATVKFIKEQYALAQLDSTGYQKLDDADQYDDELFVLKLIVADIESDTKQNVKELFLNAEYSRKILKSKHDKKKLENLFENIHELYRDSFNKYIHTKDQNSGILLAEVHGKITDEDSKLLKSLMPSLKVFHKKGMLHQMANSEDHDVWWHKEKSLIVTKGD